MYDKKGKKLTIIFLPCCVGPVLVVLDTNEVDVVCILNNGDNWVHLFVIIVEQITANLAV